MRAKRKPILVACWHNSIGKRPDGGPPEPMPPWVRSVAEKGARPGTTFLIEQVNSRILCPAENVLYQAPDNSVHAISIERFQAEYEPINVAAPAAKTPGDKK